MKRKIKIATLCCCYNRVNKTIKFLDSLTSQLVPENCQVDYYLLDDASPDNTGEIVMQTFPMVNVIAGSGSLFWAGGMRTLWGDVLEKNNYDFFLLLNDDVILSKGAIERLLNAYELANFPGSIILGTVVDPLTNKITYGGLKMKSRLTGFSDIQIPEEFRLVACELGNANIMLVDQFTVNKIGILSKEYTHGLADFDYTYTAIKNNLKVWLAPGYFGMCENDHGKNWLSKGKSLKERIAYLYSPKGLAYKEYLRYVSKHFPFMLPSVIFKAWLKTLFPFVYDAMKK